MYSSEVISVNIWQMIISIANLLILFFMLKKFLYKPVQSMLARRQEIINNDFEEARKAKDDAEKSRKKYNEKLSAAQAEADVIVSDAKAKAQRKSDKLIANAKEKADEIMDRAKADAELEKKKAEADIRNEITEVSTLLSEKILEREINKDDHRKLIDSFIENLGDSYDGNQ
ncbi:MAG: F0F1 ATP synthase subunit B [Clostridia bacterium]|nr:F0F1 ATP synthase subunit B [Clostridia bacterium]